MPTFIPWKRWFRVDNLPNETKGRLGWLVFIAPDCETMVRWSDGAWRTRRGNSVEPVGYSHFMILGEIDGA